MNFPPLEGGASTMAVELSRALVRQGHAVTVLAPEAPDTDAFDAGEPAAVTRFRRSGRGWSQALGLLRTGWRPAGETDLLLAINPAHGGVLGRLARLFHGTPYVILAHGDPVPHPDGNPTARWLYHSVYRHGLRTIATSHFDRDRLADFGVDEMRLHVVLPGARPPEPAPPDAIAAARHALDLEGAPYILAVGRFIPRKGHITLVEALPLLQEQGIHAHLVMAGRGPERGACRRKAAALGLEGMVHCPGYVPDDTLRALYQDCACFALPAGEDESGNAGGFGLVFAEAHAYGKPVVAGRSGGAVDAVRHEETGLLVPPDNPDRLAAALGRILGNPEFAERLGAAGKARVEAELNWDRFAERMMDTVGIVGCVDIVDDVDPVNKENS